jgi:hypothetical protein
LPELRESLAQAAVVDVVRAQVLDQLGVGQARAGGGVGEEVARGETLRVERPALDADRTDRVAQRHVVGDQLLALGAPIRVETPGGDADLRRRRLSSIVVRIVVRRGGQSGRLRVRIRYRVRHTG